MAGTQRRTALPEKSCVRSMTSAMTLPCLSMKPRGRTLSAAGPRKTQFRERARVLRIARCTPLQWPLLLERAYSHQVYPLVYRNLLDLGFSGVPEAVQSELKGQYLANALRNQLLAEELARLLGLLEGGWDSGHSLEGRCSGAVTLRRSGGPGLCRHRHSGSAYEG